MLGRRFQPEPRSPVFIDLRPVVLAMIAVIAATRSKRYSSFIRPSEDLVQVTARGKPDPATVVHEIGFCERHTGSPLRTNWARNGSTRRIGTNVRPACPTNDSVRGLSAPPSRASTA